MANGIDRCLLKDKLSLLRKSSEYAVDHIEIFDDEKAYLHVYREIEGDLKQIIKSVNDSQEIKSLILLTGSAGDGKSHLLAYLKALDPDHILDGYRLINDATESEEPLGTAVETLANRLKDFNDENLPNSIKNKTIVAINLGMLNNFIESEYSEGFQKLREFVKRYKLITNSGGANGYIENSPFQNISFSDYQFFALTKEDYDDSYLIDIFQKVTSKTETNPFYRAFSHCDSCSKKTGCPIRANYIFFSEPNVQNAVAYKVIEAIICSKVIVTMRRLLDFIYGILVGPDEELNKLWAQNGVATKTLQTYLHLTLPFLLNKTNNMNPLSSAIEQNNVLSIRTRDLDARLIQLFSTSNFSEIVTKIEGTTPYNLSHFVEPTIFERIQDKTDIELKTNLILFDLFLKECERVQLNSNLQQYLQYLFAFAKADRKALMNMWKLASKTIKAWNGLGEMKESNKICFDGSLHDYWLFENCKVNIVSPLHSTSGQMPLIYRFSPTIVLNQKDTSNKIDVDYSLFSLMKRMENGNRPTQEERDLFIDFSRFIQRIIESGSLKEEIQILPKEADNHSKQYWFRKTEYGEYEFGE